MWSTRYLEKLPSDIELQRYSKVGQLDKEELYVEYLETTLRYGATQVQ
jgi:hypothetical protein